MNILESFYRLPKMTICVYYLENDTTMTFCVKEVTYEADEGLLILHGYQEELFIKPEQLEKIELIEFDI